MQLLLLCGEHYHYIRFFYNTKPNHTVKRLLVLVPLLITHTLRALFGIFQGNAILDRLLSYNRSYSSFLGSTQAYLHVTSSTRLSWHHSPFFAKAQASRTLDPFLTLRCSLVGNIPGTLILSSHRLSLLWNYHLGNCAAARWSTSSNNLLYLKDLSPHYIHYKSKSLSHQSEVRSDRLSSITSEIYIRPIARTLFWFFRFVPIPPLNVPTWIWRFRK